MTVSAGYNQAWPYGHKADGLRSLAELEQVASEAGGFRIFPYLLQGDQFAVVFGYDAQENVTAVFGIGLIVAREIWISFCYIRKFRLCVFKK